MIAAKTTTTGKGGTTSCRQSEHHGRCDRKNFPVIMSLHDLSPFICSL
jgi:hypothetical protein